MTNQRVRIIVASHPSDLETKINAFLAGDAVTTLISVQVQRTSEDGMCMATIVYV